MKRTTHFVVLSFLLGIGFYTLFPSKAAAPASEGRDPTFRLTASAPLPRGEHLRYRPELDPANSAEAAANYYRRRHEMIAEFNGPGQIEAILKRLGGSEDLPSSMGQVKSIELVEALPRIAQLLENPDPMVQRAAAETLCWFRDKRGFDFIMAKMEQPDSSDWWTIFEKDFATQYPVEYIPRLKTLLSIRSGSDAYIIAKALAKMGDPASIPYLLPIIEKRPVISVDTITLLGNVKDSRVTEALQRLSASNPEDSVKIAADIALLRSGDAAASRRVMDEARKVIALPQPKNADGSPKPGFNSKTFELNNPAWNEKAFLALENGMQYVAPADAVPLLREIAISADNIRFSVTAIKLLAKIGDEAARTALQDTARSVLLKKRTFEDSLCTTAGKALSLFNDKDSDALAVQMFNGYNREMNASRYLAETRGWDGLFKLELSY